MNYMFNWAIPSLAVLGRQKGNRPQMTAAHLRRPAFGRLCRLAGGEWRRW